MLCLCHVSTGSESTAIGPSGHQSPCSTSYRLCPHTLVVTHLILKSCRQSHTLDIYYSCHGQTYGGMHDLRANSDLSSFALAHIPLLHAHISSCAPSATHTLTHSLTLTQTHLRPLTIRSHTSTACLLADSAWQLLPLYPVSI